MEEIYPRWLNKDFIEKALKSAGDSNVEVDTYDVTNASEPGDNYMSDMYRVTASVTRGFGPEVTSFIVKSSRKSGDVNEVRDSYNERKCTTANCFDRMQFPADLFINIRGDYCHKPESSNVACLFFIQLY
jgi:hypothetical protein